MIMQMEVKRRRRRERSTKTKCGEQSTGFNQGMGKLIVMLYAILH